MSTDRLALIALEQRVQGELMYFELVKLIFSERHRWQQLYVCVGKTSLFFVQRNLSGMWPRPPDGEAAKIPYSHVARVVEDKNSFYNLAIDLNDNGHPFWLPGRLVLCAEHRSRLLVYLRVAWQTELLWRVGILRALPCTSEDLPGIETGKNRLAVMPFHGYKVVIQDGYSFCLPADMEDVGSRMHTASTGTYANPKQFKFTVQIQDPRPLDSLAADYSDHIRWVAVRQRQTMATGEGVLIVRNGFYLKKMNLTNDIAQWTGWRTFMKSDTEVKVMMFLRRQFIPPLADTAQDMFVTLSCPKHVLDDPKGGVSDDDLLTMASVAADSFSPLAQRCTMPQEFYRDMIQAKLDALLFSEESLKWIEGSLGLSPDQKVKEDARAFVKSILKILQEESALQSATLLKLIGDDVATEKDPMVFPVHMMEIAGMRYPPRENHAAAHSFYARVAGYLAFSVDGGILGTRLSLADLTEPWIPTPRSQAKIDEIIMFFLHIRPKDMNEAYEHRPLRLLMHDSTLFDTNTFNDRVMQSLVELGWIQKALERDKPHRSDERQGRDDKNLAKLSLDYSKFLAMVLMCKASSINLKASVCRQLNHSDASEHFGVLCPALLQTVQHTSIYLRTYATLSLINISANHDFVKDRIIQEGIIQMCDHNLKSYDDDLTRYTLVLLTHFTKNIKILKDLHMEDGDTKAPNAEAPNAEARAGQVTHTLMKLLEKTPTWPSKQSLLADLAAVIGQLCADEQIWKWMCNHPTNPMNRLMELYKGAQPGGQLRSKVMFALRIFIDRADKDAAGNRELVAKLIPDIAADIDLMCNDKLPRDDDNAASSILLLGALCKSRRVAEEAVKTNAREIDLISALHKLSLQPVGSMDSTRDRLHKLLSRLEDIKRRGPPKA